MGLFEEDIIEEYFSVTSTPKDANILGNLEIWVYNSDREEFPPHCHVKTSDNSIEFEVSILNWRPFRIKRPQTKMINGWAEIDANIKKIFFEWLASNSTQRGMEETSNKKALWIQWNANNPTNLLEKWINNREIPNIDEELKEFVNPKIDIKKLYKSIIGELTEIYFNDSKRRHELHKLAPQELLQKIGLNFDIENNREAIDTVINAERQVYLWSQK